eukprot:Skav219103  [mRNA]  locus=scaffold1574:213925:217359:- [translate_table: standard]
MKKAGQRPNEYFIYAQLLAYATAKPKESKRAEQCIREALEDGRQVSGKLRVGIAGIAPNQHILNGLGRALGRKRAADLLAELGHKVDEHQGKTTILKKPRPEFPRQVRRLQAEYLGRRRAEDHPKLLEERVEKLRNYFEATDGLIWVVDSADRQRLEARDPRGVERLLQEERLAGAASHRPKTLGFEVSRHSLAPGATLLIFANKQDLPGALRCPQHALVPATATIQRSRTAAEIRDFLQLEQIKRRHWPVPQDRVPV